MDCAAFPELAVCQITAEAVQRAVWGCVVAVALVVAYIGYRQGRRDL